MAMMIVILANNHLDGLRFLFTSRVNGLEFDTQKLLLIRNKSLEPLMIAKSAKYH